MEAAAESIKQHGLQGFLSQTQSHIFWSAGFSTSISSNNQSQHLLFPLNGCILFRGNFIYKVLSGLVEGFKFKFQNYNAFND